MIDQFGKAFLTMFGVGYFKYAPGTAASLITCLIYLLINKYFVLIYFLIFLTIVSIYSIIFIDRIYKKKDEKEIVIDEFIGQSIPIFYSYYLLGQDTFNAYLFMIILSFLLFRFFDILKIFPISVIDNKLKNGLGVVLDDILAGIYSAVIIYFLAYFELLDSVYAYLFL